MSLQPFFACLSSRFLFIGNIGWGELLVILFLVLLFFGPRRLPELAESIGKSIGRFRKASRDVRDELEQARPDVKEDTEKRG